MNQRMGKHLVDFHCHLDLYPDFENVILECERDQIYTLTVTTTPKAWPRNRALTANMRFVRAGLGLHPQLVAERSLEISLWEEYFSEAKYIGEVGLDAGPQYFRSLGLQTEVFTKVLRACNEQGGKVLTVHSFRAAKQVLDLIEANLAADRAFVVLHWFTGTKSEARRALELGCYFSINAEMIRSERHRELVGFLPADRILTETDGPFTRRGGRPSRPSDVAATVQELSALRKATPEALAETILGNLRRVVFEI